MLFIADLNSLSAASSYQEWLRTKVWASKQNQAFIFFNTQLPLAYNQDWNLFRRSFYFRKYGDNNNIFTMMLFTNPLFMKYFYVCYKCG